MTDYSEDMGNSFASKGLSASSCLVIKEAQLVVHETDQPDLVLDFADADGLTCEDVAKAAASQ